MSTYSVHYKPEIGPNNKKILRLRTIGVEDDDVPSNLRVCLYGMIGSGILYQVEGMEYVGDGIWRNERTMSDDAERYQAKIITYGGRVVAETPEIIWEN